MKLYGKIFFDHNGNGRQDPEEPPLTGVAIALDGINATVTNGTGWYVIDAVARGTHEIMPSYALGNASHVIAIVLAIAFLALRKRAK